MRNRFKEKFGGENGLMDFSKRIKTKLNRFKEDTCIYNKIQ